MSVIGIEPILLKYELKELTIIRHRHLNNKKETD